MTKLKITSKIKSRPGLIIGLILLMIFGFGLALRLADLTDPPLDFHPTRQLRAAIIARGMYYQMDGSTDQEQRDAAIDLKDYQEAYEPPVFERLVAISYLIIGGERLWMARIFAIAFWLIGGIGLFDLARRMTSIWGAIVALIYYLFLPLSVIASRSFQPDPFVTMLLILALWGIYRWNENRTWRWAIAAGVLAGITLFIKITAFYFLFPAVVLLLLTSRKFRDLVRDRQAWVVAILTISLPMFYYLISSGERSTGYFSYWSLSFIENLILTPRFYVLWLKQMDKLLNLAIVITGLIGIVLLPKTYQRMFILGLWIGYFFYGLAFPFQIYTHEYYSLMFVPGIALSIAPVGDLILNQVSKQSLAWKGFLIAAILLGVGYHSWINYSGMIGIDYRQEILGWQKIGRELPDDGDIIALTHDYGFRLDYYGWRHVQNWPTITDLEMLALRDEYSSPIFEEFFDKEIAGMEYFLITLMGEFDSQPMLKSMLYDNFEVYAETDAYIIFDLTHRLDQSP
jgi:4-amino-4-deoxy-L-arabinose transferase-like glycosyltransferase